MGKLKEQLRDSIKREIKNVNSMLNYGKLEDAQKLLRKLHKYYSSMNNHCRENYKKALIRAGVTIDLHRL